MEDLNKHDKEFNEMFIYLTDNKYFTEEELILVTNINGNTLQSLNDCIYSRYGVRDLESLKELKQAEAQEHKFLSSKR